MGNGSEKVQPVPVIVEYRLESRVKRTQVALVFGSNACARRDKPLESLYRRYLIIQTASNRCPLVRE